MRKARSAISFQLSAGRKRQKLRSLATCAGYRVMGLWGYRVIELAGIPNPHNSITDTPVSGI